MTLADAVDVDLPDLEYRHLRFFLAVADELHFTRAAARLGVAQPYVSQEIQRLEGALGVELFARTQRRVSLTPAGEAFRAKALDVLVATRDAADAARRAARGEIGRLVIGFAGSAGYDLLPAALRTYRAHWPEVDVVLREMTTVDQIRALRDGRIDVSMGRPRGSLPGGLAWEVVREEAALVALPSHHELAEAPTLALLELQDERWVVFDRTSGPGLFSWFVAACDAAGFAPRIGQEAGEIPTMINLVASGLGVAMVPESVSKLTRDGVVYRRLEPPPLPALLGLAWLGSVVDPVVLRFVAAVRSSARSSEDPA